MFENAELAAILEAAEELQLVHRHHHPGWPAAAAAARILPTKSGVGVCSRRAVEDCLREVIENGGERVTFGELGRRLDVDERYISSILTALPEDEWGVNGRQLIPKRPFVVLENDLRARLENEVVTVARYCREKEIQVDFLRRLLDYLKTEWSVEVCWLAEQRYVHAAKFSEEVVDRLKNELEEATSPVEFMELPLLESIEYPAEYIQQLQARILADDDLDGFWTGNTFVPTAFKTTCQEKILEQLHSRGFVDHKELKGAYIDKPDAFFEARLAGVTALSSHYVTHEWLEKLEIAGTRSLDEHGFADIRVQAQEFSPQEQAYVQDLFKKRHKKRLLNHGGCLVTQALVDELIHKAIAYASQEADKSWATAVETTVPITLATPLPWRRLLNVFTVGHEAIPQSALESIAQVAAPKASVQYMERVNELREAANGASKSVFVDKIYARFQVNMAAVAEIQDAALQDKLAQDLIAHYHRVILDGLTKLLDRVADSAGRRRNEQIEDAAKSIAETCALVESVKWMDALRSLQAELRGVAQIIGADEPSDDTLKAKKAEMQTELKAPLAKATDASLMLLVVLILLLSETGEGVLRASGKYAPKLLKILRPKIPESDYKFLSDIKSAVIAKAPLTEQDIHKLRALCQDIPKL
ncbi:hypothetical protein TWF696_005347 [Orbilia brochopaga]|uniref:Uncharacterized protein n=1 Tax=Orbilia brochopaga TaxID=3140254 RepID=A0AAV9V0J7_9PEZI